MLELDAPADDPAGLFHRDERGGENDEGCDDAGRGSEEAAPRRRPLAGMADQPQHLQRQHRQHAGHEVEDQAAEERDEDDCER